MPMVLLECDKDIPERRDGARALDLVGIGAHEDVDRVADEIDADEDEQRHREQHRDRLQQAPDDVGRHERADMNQRNDTGISLRELWTNWHAVCDSRAMDDTSSLEPHLRYHPI